MAFLLYGVTCYLVFFGTFLYLMGFVGGWVVPKSVDGPGAGANTAVAVAINLGLILLWGVQHTIMARPWFKHAWTRIIPKPVERSTFVLVASGILILMYAVWQPIPGTLWHVANPTLSAALTGVALCGWGLALYATFCINHFDLFGLRQVWMHFRGVPYVHVSLMTPALYRTVRNPLMLGFLIAFWATPTMTWSRLLFAAAMSGYILVGIAFEERDLLRALGERYRVYREQTPMLIPRLWPRRAKPISQMRAVPVAVDSTI